MATTYPPFEDSELAAGFSFLREHPKYGKLVPPKKTLKIDWFLFRVIANEIEKRRVPNSILPLLTGTVVREFVPDVNKATRELGMAYRDAIMHMFRRRRNFVRRPRSKVAQDENPTESNGQFRML